jgi:AraC-like DNA-binding protein
MDEQEQEKEPWTSNDESTWRRKIGMSSKDDCKPPLQRNVYLRRLKGLVEQRMLHFIYDEDKDTAAHEERTVLWTPIPWICHNLEISHAHLSRLFRELLGMNVIQYYDTLKVRETRIALRYIAMLQQFVTSLAVPSEYTGNGSAQFWKWLKEQYHPDFDRTALARQFDFPNANRFHRAFFFATNSTPREFENDIIRLALTDPVELEYTIARYASALTGSEAVLQRDVQLIPLELEADQTAETLPRELKYPIVLYKNRNENAAKLLRDTATLVQHYLQRFQKLHGRVASSAVE